MLDRKTFFVREHVGLVKLSNTYDILDPETEDLLGVAREEAGTLVNVVGVFTSKRNLPTKIVVYGDAEPDESSQPLFLIRRGFTFLRPKIEILDGDGRLVGWLKSKLLTIGAALRVFSADGAEVALIKGDWKGWNFRYLDSEGREIGSVTKKWAGAGKELFTSADNYIVAFDETHGADTAMLMLSAGLAIDLLMTEK